MNGEGYRDPTADTAMRKAGHPAAGQRVFEGWVPPAVWKFVKSPLLALSMMGYGTIVIIEDENEFRYRIRIRKHRRQQGGPALENIQRNAEDRETVRARYKADYHLPGRTVLRKVFRNEAQ